MLVGIWCASCDGGSDPEPKCCDEAPQCPADALDVSSCETDACFSVEACCKSQLCEPIESCDLGCSFGETLVETCDGAPSGTCRVVERCDREIYCASFCIAEPSCDAGDDEVSGNCPVASCYEVELCGASLLCADNGMAHGCPEAPPVENEPCADVGLSCEYAARGDCTETWECVLPAASEAPIPDTDNYQWHLAASTCDGAGGGGAGGSGGGSGGAG